MSAQTSSGSRPTTPSLVLGPMLRYVAPSEATIWVETDVACRVTILGTTTSTFCVAGHHYALVVVDGLQPRTATEYSVALDGELRWPEPSSRLPPSRIRTPAVDASACRVVFGSCRIAAPDKPPWSLELSMDHRGRGVDALFAYATKMIHRPPEEWPDLAVFVGDQVYADDSSPATRQRIAERRAAGADAPADEDLPADLVGGFEEMTWLYEESWSKELERWFLANVASVMVFDDHEMVDDWNISQAWVEWAETWSWWPDHVREGLMTYWLYQHLGNLSPATIADEGLLAALTAEPDGREVLSRWAAGAVLTAAGGASRQRFSVVRDLGRVRLVVIDARNARVLAPDRRRIIVDHEFEWIAEQCSADVDHLLIVSSLPVFLPGGLHGLELWNEAMCAGRWGRLAARFGEWMRRAVDLEDWPAFAASFDRLVELLADMGSTRGPHPPASISILSGDIHLSYTAELHFDRPMASRVHQLVNSPIRNALTGPERTAMRLSNSRLAAAAGRVLRRAIGRHREPVRWSIDRGPVFDNSIGDLRFEDGHAQLTVYRSLPYEEGVDPQLATAIDVDLTGRPASP